MINPKITIVTITFNSEKTLERTIKSVIEQNYDNYEYIIVDGDSKDKTLEIINRYKGKITKVVSEPDNGISDAFNKGIKMATGDLIGIINSDDGLMPGALQTIADSFEDGVDVYRGNVLLWKEDTDTKVVEVPTMHFNFGGMNKISHQSTFITRDAYNRYGLYNVECKYVMDYDLLLRFQNCGAKFKYIDTVLAYYTLSGITFSSYTRQRRLETEKVMKLNGANNIDIWKYRVIKYGKLALSKVIPKEITMKIRNRN